MIPNASALWCPNSRSNAERIPKILFVGEAVSIAHVGRPAMLARWARAIGYDVVFARGSCFSHVTCDEDLQPLDLQTIDPKTFHARLNQGQFFYTSNELERYVLAERALIQRVKPDLIVSDFRLTLSISARLEGVMLLTLQQAHWSPAAVARLPAPSFGGLGYWPRVLRRGLFAGLRPLALRIYAAPLDALRARYGMAQRRDFRVNYTDGDYCGYLDLPEWMPLFRLPHKHFFLGPLFWEPRDPADRNRVRKGSLAKASGNPVRPMCYVSMGSSGRVQVLPDVIRALEVLGYDAVVSGTIPFNSRGTPKVRYVGTVDPTSTLEHAALTVCHGGAGTVYQSLAAGVPVLCLPSNPDQELMAQAVERWGAGKGLPAESASAHELRVGILKASSNTCREAATLAALSIRTHDTYARWLSWLRTTLPFPRPSVSARKQSDLLRTIG